MIITAVSSGMKEVSEQVHNKEDANYVSATVKSLVSATFTYCVGIYANNKNAGSFNYLRKKGITMTNIANTIRLNNKKLEYYEILYFCIHSIILNVPMHFE